MSLKLLLDSLTGFGSAKRANRRQLIAIQIQPVGAVLKLNRNRSDLNAHLLMLSVCQNPGSRRSTPKWDSKRAGANLKRQNERGNVAPVLGKYGKLPDALLRAATIPGENLQ